MTDQAYLKHEEHLRGKFKSKFLKYFQEDMPQVTKQRLIERAMQDTATRKFIEKSLLKSGVSGEF